MYYSSVHMFVALYAPPRINGKHPRDGYRHIYVDTTRIDVRYLFENSTRAHISLSKNVT